MYTIKQFIRRNQGLCTLLMLFMALGIVGYLETLPY